jgi:hypothetical protein
LAELDNTRAPSERGATYRIAAYTVYPTGFTEVTHPDRRNWCLTVANAGDGWSIQWRTRCLNYLGEWEFEPPAGARSADFLRRCRYNEHAALHRARIAVDRHLVRGMTFEDFVNQIHAEALKSLQEELAEKRKAKILTRLLGDISKIRNKKPRPTQDAQRTLAPGSAPVAATTLSAPNPFVPPSPSISTHPETAKPTAIGATVR